MSGGPIKSFMFLFIILIFLNISQAAEFNTKFVEVDRFFCKNDTQNSFNYGNIVNDDDWIINTTSFNDGFIRRLNIYDYKLVRGWDASFPSGNIYYKLSKNNTEFSVSTDGKWYYIEKIVPKPIDIDSVATEYYKFTDNLRYIKSMLELGIKEATGLNCIAGSNGNNGLLDLVVFYNYPIENLSCYGERGSIFIDCSNDSTVNQIIPLLWNNLKDQDMRGYRGAYNYIFAYIDEFHFNAKDFDYINYPTIVFSQSEFSDNLESGQGIYVKHVDYLHELEDLPFQIHLLNNDIEDISNFTSLMYDKLQIITENAKSGNDTGTQKIILDNMFDNEKLKYYIFRLAYFQNNYYNALKLANPSPRAYYEDMYYKAAINYLTDFNAKLIIYQSKLDILRDLHSNYNSFTTSIFTDINNRKGANTSIIFAFFAILITVLVFLIDQILRKYGYFIIRLYVYLILIIFCINFFIFRIESYLVLFLIIILGMILWLFSSGFISLLFFYIGKLEENEEINYFSKIKIRLLCELFINSSENLDFNLHDTLKDKIAKEVTAIISNANDIFNASQKLRSENDKYKEKRQRVRRKISLYRENFSRIMFHTDSESVERLFKDYLIEFDKIEDKLYNYTQLHAIKEGNKVKTVKLKEKKQNERRT